MARDAVQVESDVQRLRDALETVLAQVAGHQATLEDLGQQHAAAVGRLELTQRQATDYSVRLAELEAELEEARLEEAAHETFLAALGARDAAGVATAAAIDGVLDGFAEFRRLQEAADAAREAVPPRYGVAALREPDELVAAWQRLVEFVRSRIDEQLQDEAVEVAARSSAGHDIGKLPEHLQPVALVRRRQLLTNARKSNSGDRRT
jgi:hypothetical protein